MQRGAGRIRGPAVVPGTLGWLSGGLLRLRAIASFQRYRATDQGRLHKPEILRNTTDRPLQAAQGLCADRQDLWYHSSDGTDGFLAIETAADRRKTDTKREAKTVNSQEMAECHFEGFLIGDHQGQPARDGQVFGMLASMGNEGRSGEGG
jgi:hypothetical protein